MLESLSDTNKSWARAAMLALLLLVGWLGARGLDADSLWYDEHWSLVYAGGDSGGVSLAETIERVSGEYAHEKNPPGYYVLLNIWGGLVGWSEAALRALSWLAGLLAVAVMYRLAADAAPESGGRALAGLGAAAALGLCAFFVDYLHETRVYTLSVLSAAAAVWAYVRAMTARSRSVFWPVAWAVAVAASLYLHYTGTVVLGALALYHLLAAPKNARWRRVTLLAAAGALCFLPWLPALFDTLSRASNLEITALSAPEAFAALAYAFSSGSVALFALFILYGLSDCRRAPLAGVLAFGGLALGLALNAFFPFVNHPRYLIVLLPGFALLAGLGAARLVRRGVHPAALLALVIGGGVWNSLNPAFVDGLPGAFPHQSWRELAAALDGRAQNGDAVVFHAGDFDWLQEPVFRYYLRRVPVRAALMESLPGTADDGEFRRQAGAFAAGAPRVWLGVNRLVAPNFRLGEFERALAADYVVCETALDLPDMRLDLYARLAPDDAAPLRFGEHIGLLPVEAAPAPGGLHVALGWRVGEAVPPGVYSVAVHVAGPDGTLAAQADYPLPDERRACRAGFIALPPGRYSLRVGVYDWRTGERLAAFAPGQGPADLLPAADVVIP